ncbi:HI1506-related protein [Roseospira goensis]|uniref:Mu-like prophage FluMu N-terminal domain-containing protein n=1 Tax=Roseospira goensis TaxID=391922 RepID=A0A7W6S2T4_9PROT|nr:HI1506-related protein [Roseospira goensis]MBB4287794.1 hypothetical protein [Roseospira goensis]
MPIRVTARHPIRRAGRSWPAEPVTVPDGDLTDAEVAALRAEPELTVEDIAPAKPAKEKPAK